MAMAAAQSLRGSRRHLLSYVRYGGSIATQSESFVVRQGSAKVSDRVLEMTAIDEDGQRHQIKGLTGHTLLRTLVERGLFDPERHRLENINACGGECEVSIANEWLDKLPPRSEDELEVLKDKTHAKKADPHARLGCQIVLEPELEGMVVSIAEEKPWRTL
ncbi:uncharacterized protein [Physcomitrium patens]|nr:uncharacterized protein LOC112293209 [Physcomitrium patens]|eukprot:XP_024398160.1 uncharacterized protein LOC112293209 [Physcomitrella patens]